MQDSITSEPTVFMDPNTLSEDGTVSLSIKKFSEDGEIFAHGLSQSGSDWSSIHFKKVETGKIICLNQEVFKHTQSKIYSSVGENYPEVLEKIKFSSITWTHDNKGIFYSSYPEQRGKTDGSETTSNENHKLYYHRLGTQQSDDILVVDFPGEPKLRMYEISL